MEAVTTVIKYFSEKELACKGTGIIKLDPRFAEELPKLREAWNSPLTVNSVCRSPEHNKKVGGNPNSLHMTVNKKWNTLGTMAADIRWFDWGKATKMKFAQLALDMGWSVGLHNSFCHIDRRADLKNPTLPQNIFLYGAWDGEFNKSDLTLGK